MPRRGHSLHLATRAGRRSSDLHKWLAGRAGPCSAIHAPPIRSRWRAMPPPARERLLCHAPPPWRTMKTAGQHHFPPRRREVARAMPRTMAMLRRARGAPPRNMRRPATVMLRRAGGPCPAARHAPPHGPPRVRRLAGHGFAPSMSGWSTGAPAHLYTVSLARRCSPW